MKQLPKAYLGLLLFVGAWAQNPCAAQNRSPLAVMHGRALDAVSGSGIPYAQLVFKNRPQGVNADSSGRFRLTGVLTGDSVLISALGYKPMLVLGEFLGDTVFRLQPDTHRLAEVMVEARRVRYRRERLGLFGSKTAIGIRRIRGRFLTLGMQVALLVRNPTGKSGVVKSVSYRLSPDEETKGAGKKGKLVGRVRLYSVGSRQQPDRDLLTESVTVPISASSSSIHLDLEKYLVDFPVNGMFVSLELIDASEAATLGDTMPKAKAPWLVIANDQEENITFMNYRGRGWSKYGYGIGKDGKYRKFQSSNVRFGVDILFEE